ncbi:MAG: hypothetical protein ACRDH5_19815, partial [bacterium]
MTVSSTARQGAFKSGVALRAIRMQAFRVTGHFVMGWQDKQVFDQEILAADEATANDRVLSRLG